MLLCIFGQLHFLKYSFSCTFSVSVFALFLCQFGIESKFTSYYF